MEVNGKPFVPPLCPANKSGDKHEVSPAEFHLSVRDLSRDPHGPAITEVAGVFFEGEFDIDTPPYIATKTLEMPNESPDAGVARWMNPDVNPDSTRRIGQILCDRIAQCHGVTDKGECWALGRSGLAEAIRQYNRDQTNN